MRKLLFALSVTLFFTQILIAQKISGTVTGYFDEPLSFASIIVKGTSIGVSANDSGKFSMSLQPGTYILQCAHVGYTTAEKKITISESAAVVNFQLEVITYYLKDVKVKSGQEDPAYEIIRNAIKKRAEYEKEQQKFQCEVYIKGQLQLRNYPKKFLGNPVDFEDGDTSKKKMIFLSETLAKYFVDQPNTKTEVISTRVSGNSDGFGFSMPQIISFYNSNVQIGKNLNQRGFISPIADNALQYYHYKFTGSFYDNGKIIDRIVVTPIRKFEPLFNGYINIIEESWRIYSLQLFILKENQMQFLDTLKIEQTYVPINNTWVIKQQVIYPSFKLLGFDGYGNFVQVYNKFDLNPNFPQNFFNNTVLKYQDSANKKPTTYWDSIRPIPLRQEEISDYQKKDSLEIARKNPHYLDSLDRIKSKIRFGNIFITGETFYKTKDHFSFFEPAIINIINYNTVEGWVVSYSPIFDKTFKDKDHLSLLTNVRYGFSNHHFNSHITGIYDFNTKNTNSLFFSGGRNVFQFNNDQPVSIRSNTIVSLVYHQNYLKIYQAAYGRLAYTKGFGNGVTATVTAEYQDRMPLENTTDYSFFNIGNHHFTPNYPVELTDMNIPHHQALVSSLNIEWIPGAKYIEFPNKKMYIGSKYPTITANITQGIYGVFSSDVDYTKWSLGVIDTINLKLAGKFDYHVTFGGFFNAHKTYIPDYNQYLGNRGTFASDYLNTYLLMFYYQFSNTAPLYVSGHAEYHLNGLLSNKIPLFRKENWFFVVGANTLNISNSQYYYEGYFSIENIFKIGRIDFIQAYLSPGMYTSGVRISVNGLLDGPRDN